jgi:hypothetical protein
MEWIKYRHGGADEKFEIRVIFVCATAQTVAPCFSSAWGPKNDIIVKKKF